MRVRYSTNWMGPINDRWIEENGNDWSAGRIDVYGDDVPEYEEIGLGVMKHDDWHTLTRWLNNLVTPEIWTYDQIIQAYEFHNPKITWWRETWWSPDGKGVVPDGPVIDFRDKL